MGGSTRESRGEEPDPAKFDPLPGKTPDAAAARQVKSDALRQSDENIIKMMQGFALYHLEMGEREYAVRCLIIAGRIALRRNLQIKLLGNKD